MKRLVLILGLQAALTGLWAQGTPSRVTIQSNVSTARFTVDGIVYRGSASFFWSPDTQHSLDFPVSKDGYQYEGGPVSLSNARYVFDGWSDPSGTLSLDGHTVVVSARPEVTQIDLNVIRQFRHRLIFWDAPAALDEPIPAGCPARNMGGPGVVIINDVCYWRNFEFWGEEGEMDLVAYTYPGWAFTGWALNGGPPNSMVRKIPVTGPLSIRAFFRPAKQVTFVTEPLGFNIMIDLAPTATPRQDPCASWETLPPSPAPGAARQCPGVFYWASGTTHTIGAIVPQVDSMGNPWLLDKFSNGQENHSAYEVTSTTPEKLVAKFVRGARVSFNTVPSGLQLGINGRSNYRAYNFVVKPGDVMNASAPAEQLDANGRRWTFQGWSNGGDRVQDVTIPATAVDEGFRLTATYELLSRAVITTSAGSGAVLVDGVECPTPCKLDKPGDTKITVEAPETYNVNHAFRLEFDGWADGADRTRIITISGSESAQYVANYKKMYRLETVSVPEDAIEILVQPSSPDGFYLEGTKVRVEAQANDGYKFIRWEGNLQGSVAKTSVTMLLARRIIAVANDVPFAYPVSVGSAVGKTPEEIVSPGSMITVFGADLAPYAQTGPASPLSQNLAGATVWVADRPLALMYVSPEQINAVMHPDTPEGMQKVVVTRPGQLDSEGEVMVRRNAPGLFTHFIDGRFFVVATHEDGTAVSLESPARKGETIAVYGTGFGPYDKIAPYGFPLPASPEFPALDKVTAVAGDLKLTPEFAGGAPGANGMDLVKIKITKELPAASTLEFKLRINGRESNTALLPLE